MTEKSIKARKGRDANLEAEANAWLRQGVGKNKRSRERDFEKMGYEAGIYSVDELKHYDPTNDWDTRYSTKMVTSDDIDYMPTTITGDDNIRHEHLELVERHKLTAHTEDSDSGGRVFEELPELFDHDVRKVCTKCNTAKGRECFSRDLRNKDGLHSWCKVCRKRLTSQSRERGRSAE